MCQCRLVGCHKWTLWGRGVDTGRGRACGDRVWELSVFSLKFAVTLKLSCKTVHFQKLPASASEQDKCRSDQRAHIPRGWLNREQLSGFCHLIRPRGILPAAAGKFREGKSRGLAHPAHTDGRAHAPPAPPPRAQGLAGPVGGKANVPRGRRRASARLCKETKEIKKRGKRREGGETS